MAFTPTDIANRALDAAGVDFTLGDIEEGTRPGQVCLRAYGDCLRALLRSVNWDFARKTADLVLLADASGQTSNVGTVVPTPWVYEYAYPTDCLKARFVPQNFAYSGSVPLMTGLQPANSAKPQPASFLVATDFNYPPNLTGNYWELHGVSPSGQTVILTNVASAKLVYTALMIYPNVWDAQFMEAMIAYLASEIALPLAKDKKFGMQLRNQNILICKKKIEDARLTDGNEGTYSINREASWISARNGGAPMWAGADGASPWGADSPITFSDGSAY